MIVFPISIVLTLISLPLFIYSIVGVYDKNFHQIKRESCAVLAVNSYYGQVDTDSIFQANTGSPKEKLYPAEGYYYAITVTYVPFDFIDSPTTPAQFTDAYYDEVHWNTTLSVTKANITEVTCWVYQLDRTLFNVSQLDARNENWVWCVIANAILLLISGAVLLTCIMSLLTEPEARDEFKGAVKNIMKCCTAPPSDSTNQPDDVPSGIHYTIE